jgi:hypothetical protein
MTTQPEAHPSASIAPAPRRPRPGLSVALRLGAVAVVLFAAVWPVHVAVLGTTVDSGVLPLLVHSRVAGNPLADAVVRQIHEAAWERLILGLVIAAVMYAVGRSLRRR